MAAPLAALLASAPGFAAEAPPRPAGIGISAPKKTQAGAPPSESALNFRISFRIKLDELESAGNFVVQDGSQGNYVTGGDAPIEVQNSRGDKGLEFKKHATIVNCLPASFPEGGRVLAQCQFELSGPGRPATSFQARPPSTFQLQTSFVAALGRSLLLVDEPNRRVEIKIEPLRD